MANTTTTSKTATKTTVTADDQKYKNLEQENQALKEKIQGMESKMDKLMEQLMQIASNRSQEKVETISSYDKEIEVTNLCVGPLLLSTNGRSDGKRYDFEYQFQTLNIPESDLKEIVRSMPNTSRSGRFFIDNKDFVKNSGLQSSYNNMLDRVKLSNIFSLDASSFVQEYKNASKVQRSIIDQMITVKCMNDEPIDANILRAMSKETGKDYMNIEPLPEEYGMMKEG